MKVRTLFYLTLLCVISNVNNALAQVSPPGQPYFPDEHATISITVTDSGIIEHTAAPSTKSSFIRRSRHSSNQIVENAAIAINIQTTNSTCNTLNGSISASASGGLAPYKYWVDGDGPFDNGYYPRIGPGNHVVEVIDANGLTASVNAVVSNTNDPPKLTVTSFAHPTGCDRSDGSFVVVQSGGQPPYEYTLDLVNFRSSGSFTNLPAGNHVVIVRDANGCLGSARIPLLSPYGCNIPFGLTYSSFCDNSGTVKVIYLGTDPPYENRLNGAPFGTTTEYTNMAAGEYVLEIRSGTGEKVTFMFHIVKSCYPRVSVQTADASCNSSDGSITLSTSNGVPPYRYSIDGIHFQASNQFSGLATGRYNVGVVDAEGVVLRAVADVTGGCFNVTENHSDVVCGNHNGTITLSASGGKSPYAYSIDGVNFQATNKFTGLEAGTYVVSVKDGDGTRKTLSVEIKNTPGPQQIIPSSPPACRFDKVKLSISVVGGVLPLQYSLNGIDYQSKPEFEIYAGDFYNITVKDANGCKLGLLYQTPISCFTVSVQVFNAVCGNNNGRLEVSASDGRTPYEYSIDGSNFQTSSLFNNLPPRNYDVTVSDADGITRKINAEVKSTCAQLKLDIQSSTCGDANGVINVEGINGQEPYQFSLDGTSYTSTSSFAGLYAGTYTVSLKDASGYTIQQQVVIETTTSPQINVHATDASCSSAGVINITGTGGTGPLMYSIDGNNFSANPVFKDVQPALYSAYVTDHLGCKSSAPVEIKLINDLAFELTNDITVCEGTSVSLAVVNPRSSYQYSWTPADDFNLTSSSSVNVRPHKTTEYTVQVAEGLCKASQSVLVTVLPAPIANAGDDVTICSGQSIQLNGSGGTKYSWSPAKFLSDASAGNPIVNKPATSQEYSLMVEDGNGCQSLQPSKVLVKVTPPTILFAGNDTTITRGVPLQLNAVDINNSGFISYEWMPAFGLDNARIKNPVTTLYSNMTYSVTGVTENGCEGSGEIRISVYEGPDIYVPNAFTPNADGINDEFKAVPVGIKTFRYLAVFNRWGQQVFYTTDAARGWKGASGTKTMDTGTFIWKTEGIDFNGKTVSRKGFVQLIR